MTEKFEDSELCQRLKSKRFKAWDLHLSKMIPVEECLNASFFELFLKDRSRFRILISTYTLDRDGVEIFDQDLLEYGGHPRPKVAGNPYESPDIFDDLEEVFPDVS